jgi:DNA-binding Lrp family transcriptional regulator
MRTELDAVDRRILELLTEDGRRTASEVGRLVKLSPAAASRRINRLEHEGVIAGYRAIVDYATLGAAIEAFCEVSFDGKTRVEDIENGFSDIPEVSEVFTIAGDPDALVRVRVRDLDHLKQVIDSIRRTGRITGTKTLIVLGATRRRG